MTKIPPEPGGVVVIDKPAGLTSHDVVARLRRQLGIRRVGHAGTLDPMATGVLVAAFGAGTRLLPYLQETRKEYRGTIRLGLATTTDDRTGEPLGQQAAVAATASDLEHALGSFRGCIDQRPSAVSAVKVGGRRAYKLVRQGERVDLPARPVQVHRFELLADPRSNGLGGSDIDVLVECSSGTYIRALARDVGALLGCGGHLTVLRRTRVGPFAESDATELAAEDAPAPRVVRLAVAAAAVLPVVSLSELQAVQVGNGLPIEVPPRLGPGPIALLSPTGELVAIARGEDSLWRYQAVFA